MKCIVTILILFITISLSACAVRDPISFYEPVPHLMKFDSKADKFGLPKEAPDMARVKKQKNKNIKASYKLDGIQEFKALAIVKEVTLEKNKIEVVFTAESMGPHEDTDPSIKKYIWQNVLFLLYTITDTFPEIEDIRLQADYYYLDKYGNPYKEVVFMVNTEKQIIEKINSDYFQIEMLEQLLDYYLAEDLMMIYEKESK